MMGKVINLLHEFQDLFATKFSEMKGISGDLGEMKIHLKPNEKPVKQRPYRLNPRYKEHFKYELEQMLDAGIIEPSEKLECISLMVVEDKKTSDIGICVNLRKLNDTSPHDQFRTLLLMTCYILMVIQDLKNIRIIKS